MGRKRAEGNERLGEYIQRRSGGMLELRFPLPVDVREAFLNDRGKPRTHIIKSLGTTDVKVANAKADQLRARIRSEIDQVRGTRKSLTLSSYLHRLYEEEIAQFHIEAAADARSGVLGLSEQNEGLRTSTRRSHAKALVSGNPIERVAVAGWAADRYLSTLGRSPENAPDYQEIVDQCANTIFDALAAQNELSAGRPLPKALAAALSAPKAAGAANASSERGRLSLSAYFENVYLPAIQKTGEIEGQNTISGKALAVRLFAELVGDLPIGGIEKAHLWQFHDDLQQLPNSRQLKGNDRALPPRQLIEASKRGDIQVETLHPKTIGKHLSGVKSILTFAEQRRDIFAAQTAGVRAKFDRSVEAGRAFTTEELNRIFAQPLFTGSLEGIRPNGWRKPGHIKIRDDRYWLPLVMLFTGARPSEVAGLRTEDVIIEHDVPHFILVPSEVRRLKNPKSKRMVPIHSRLIDLCFLDFARDTERQTDGRFFPMVEQLPFKEHVTGSTRKKGLSSSKVLRDFNEYVLADANARQNRGSNKCFRNTFEQEALATIPSDEVRRRLTGRDVNSTVQIYTQNIPDDPIKRNKQLRMLQAELEKIRYDGVVLPMKDWRAASQAEWDSAKTEIYL